MMFWSDYNFCVFIVANFWVDHRRFIMQDSGNGDVIVGFNWTSNSQLSIHIDFTTLKGFDIFPNPNSDGKPQFGIAGDYKSHRLSEIPFFILLK